MCGAVAFDSERRRAFCELRRLLGAGLDLVGCARVEGRTGALLRGSRRPLFVAAQSCGRGLWRCGVGVGLFLGSTCQALSLCSTLSVKASATS